MAARRPGSAASAAIAPARAVLSPGGTDLRAGLAQDLRRLAGHRAHHGPSGREALEHLRRDERGEQRHVAQRDQADVGRRQQRGDLVVRDAGEQRDVAQPEFGHPVRQALLVRPLPHEREPDRLASQPGRGVGHRREALRDAVRPGVEHQAVAGAGAEPGAQPRVRRRPGIELAGADAVADGMDLGGRHAAPDQVGAEPVAHHDHGVGRRVGGEFQPFQQSDEPAVGQHAEFGEDGRPQVADLHHEAGALEPGQQPAGPDREKRGRGDHHDVGRPAGAPAEQHTGDHEAQVADGLAGDAFVRGGVEPGAQHPVAVAPFPEPDGAAVFGRDHPGRVVGHAGQDRDMVAVRGPGRGQAGQAGLRGAGLRREIVGHDEDPHGHRASARATWRLTRWRASSAGDRR